MTLFGRDSLWASEMALPVDPSLALGTLRTLADRQGKEVNTDTEEEPGKILHEVRLDVSSGQALRGSSAYYGSVDATPLFMVAVGSVSRWGFAKDTIAELLPNADRALDWIRHYGDRDGDGYVEYGRPNQHGLINQGWKDSWDGINFADGTLAEAPIALAEVQAYVHGAYVARAWMAYDDGDLALASGCGNALTGSNRNSMRTSGCRTRATTLLPSIRTSAKWMPALRTWAIACGSGSWTRTRFPRSWST